jgi:hypothetical protein
MPLATPGRIGGMPDHQPEAVLQALAGDHRLRGYLQHGQVATMPSKRSRRLALLHQIAAIFEPGVRCPEPVVNELLKVINPDYAMLRRYLVDEDLLERADGEYWRIGGPVEPSA